MTGARFYRIHRHDEPASTVMNRARSDRWVASDEERSSQPEGISASLSLDDLAAYVREYSMNVRPDDQLLELRGHLVGRDRDRYAVRVAVDSYRTIPIQRLTRLLKPRLRNPAEDIWDVAEYVRQRFVASGYSKLRRTHIKVEWSIDSWDDGKRTVAACSADGLRMWVSPRLEEFDRNRQLALLAHEFGHAVQGLYGLEVPDRHDDVERDADVLAEYVMGRHLFYAPVEGRLLQTLDSRAPGAVRPRPRGLR